MSLIYGYCRGVHVRARERAKDVAVQVTTIRRYTRWLMRTYRYLSIGEIYTDLGTRGTGVRGLARTIRTSPSGQQLLLKLKRGDHLIIGRYARVFSTARDFVATVRICQQRGVIVHLAQKDLKVCMDAPAGMLLMRIFQDISDGKLFDEEQAMLAKYWRQCARLRTRLTG